MRPRLWRVAARLYPAAWRARYAEELSDLCDELVAVGETTPTRLSAGLLPAALAERARSASRLTLIATGVALLALSSAVAANAFGLLGAGPRISHWLGPHTTRDSRLITLRRGEVETETSMREPGGYILLAQVSAPKDVRIVVYATAEQAPPNRFTGVFSTFPLGHDDILLSCHSYGAERTCTQGGLEWCPLIPSKWRLRIVKESGPASRVQLNFLVGARPTNLSVGKTDSWVTRFDVSWMRQSEPAQGSVGS